MAQISDPMLSDELPDREESADRIYNAPPKFPPRQCQGCKRLFTPTGARQLYCPKCSPALKAKAPEVVVPVAVPKIVTPAAVQDTRDWAFIMQMIRTIDPDTLSLTKNGFLISIDKLGE